MYPPPNFMSAYGMQNSQQMADVSALLGRYGVPPGTYQMPYMPPAPNLFGQMGGMVGQILGPGAGDMFSALGAFATNPAFAGYLGPIPGAVSNLMGSLPMGGGDPYAMMQSRMMSGMGRGMPQMAALPTDMGNAAMIQAYNNQQQQFAAFTGAQNSNIPSLLAFGAAGTQFASGTDFGVATQIANIGRLQQAENFANPFALFAGLNNVNMQDADLQKLAGLAASPTAANAAEAQRLLSDASIRRKAEGAINAANNASSLSNFAPMGSQLLQQLGVPMDSPLGQVLEGFMDIAGGSNNPALFTPAALQSLSTMGGLRTGMDPSGEFYAERVTQGLVGRMGGSDPSFAGIRRMGSRRAGEMMSELSRSGILTTSGVDTFGNLNPEDVQRLEEGIARQLESFTRIADLGKRVGMNVGQVTQALNTMYGGTLAATLEDAVTRNFTALSADPSMAGKSEDFLRNEANRRAARDITDPLDRVVQMGAMLGMDAQTSMGMAMAHTEMARRIGGGAGMGTAMATMTMELMGANRGTRSPVLSSTAAATLAGDITSKAMRTDEGRMLAALVAAQDVGAIDAAGFAALEAQVMSGQISMGQFEAALTGAGVVNARTFLGSDMAAYGRSRMTDAQTQAVIRRHQDGPNGLGAQLERGLLVSFGSNFAGMQQGIAGNAAAVNALASAGVDLSAGRDAVFARLTELSGDSINSLRNELTAAGVDPTVVNAITGVKAEAMRLEAGTAGGSPGAAAGLLSSRSLTQRANVNVEVASRLRAGAETRFAGGVGDRLRGVIEAKQAAGEQITLEDILTALPEATPEGLQQLLADAQSGIDVDISAATDPSRRAMLVQAKEQMTSLAGAQARQLEKKQEEKTSADINNATTSNPPPGADSAPVVESKEKQKEPSEDGAALLSKLLDIATQILTQLESIGNVNKTGAP